MLERPLPITWILIAINVAMYGLKVLFPQIEVWLELWPPQLSPYEGEGTLFRPWQLLTHGFMHGNLPHLFFNMFALFMFGTRIEQLFGPRRFLIYYLTCVVGAAALHMFVTTVANLPFHPMVGASGAVFGVLLAFGMAFPKERVMLIFPPIPMPAWLFVTLYGVLELCLGVTQTQEGVAHFAHLGGMLTGFVMIRYWQQQARRMRR